MAADLFVYQVATNWRDAPLSPANVALCEFAETLSLRPHTMNPEMLDHLRELGFDDTAIHDATQVISYFNYINRVADALGVELEDHIRPWEQGRPV